MADAMADEVDWGAVEVEYRAGQLSVREVARRHGVAYATLADRAKRLGWTRDLSGEVRREVQRRVAMSALPPLTVAVNLDEPGEAAAAEGGGEPRADQDGDQQSDQGNGADQPAGVPSRAIRPPDHAIVEAAANRGALVVQGHLDRAATLREHADRMSELLRDYLSGDEVAAAEAGKRLFVAKSDGPGSILQALAETNERIQRMERVSLNLDGDGSGERPVFNVQINLGD